MTFPGPAALGRGVLVSSGAPAPDGFEGAPRFVIDQAVLAEPRSTVEAMHGAWAARTPVVVEVAADVSVLRSGEVWDDEPHRLDPRLELWRDRLHFLLWANNYDMRDGEPVWWWGRKAERAFDLAPSVAADVEIDGTATWCDGGPRGTVSIDGGLLHSDSIEAGVMRLDVDAPPTADLAPDQMAAVAHGGGPLRVIAPAGSGKTRVLTERLRHLVQDRRWHPGSICALAYNKRAADEMLERTAGLDLRIRTLNSIALAVVNGTGGFAATGQRRQVIEEMDVRRMLEGMVEVQHAPNTDPYVPYLDGLRAIRLGLRDPDEVEVSFEAPGLADAFPRFQGALDDRNVVDFDGQLYEAIKLLLRRPDVRRRAQLLCRHLLVDEFQDLTPAHMLLVRLLAGPSFDVFGVGDDDQVIYGFGGATPDYLLDFETYFPGAHATELKVNYRCPPTVITKAKALLAYNDKRITKEINPGPGRQPDAAEWTVDRVAESATARRATAVLDEWHDDGDKWTDMAVLTRVNSTLLPVQVMLGEAGVPCRNAVSEAILDRTGTRAALAYLRMGLQPDVIKKGDVFETVRRPGRRIARNVVDMMTKKAKTSVREIEKLSDYLSGNDSQKVLGYAGDIQRIATVLRKGTTADALRCIRVDIGLGDAMETLDGSRREADRSTHADDLLALEQVAQMHDDPATFEAWLRTALRRRSDDDGVELSTVHRVKGMEWPSVVVFGVDDGLMPHRLSENEEEERRLVHVAITRSSRRAHLIASTTNSSPFLEEFEGSRPRTPLRVKPEPPVSTTARVTRVVKDEPELDEAQTALRSALVAWRREAAKRDGVPPYVVLSNDDVITVTLKAPKTLRELSACKGIGTIRLERWGDELLSVIEENTA